MRTCLAFARVPIHGSRAAALGLLLLLLHGCAEHSDVGMMVQGHPPRPWRYDSNENGTIEWYSASDLDRIVRQYARDRRVAFDFRGTTTSFSIARERDCMVEGSYTSGLGKPVLTVKIGWDGYVTEHQIATLICGIGTDIAATRPTDK